MLGLPYTFPVNLTRILLRGCNSTAIYGMKGMLPVPISSFSFPHFTPIRAPALATETVLPLALAYNPYRNEFYNT
jgi:hypothetical protein